jgi:hypothetical protein
MKKFISLYRYLPADAAMKTIESRCFRVSRIPAMPRISGAHFGLMSCRE